MANALEVKASRFWLDYLNIGHFWFLVAVVSAGFFFADGLEALLAAWALPEYSHGPLIPILSAFLFLRQLKDHPPDPGPKRHRWIGVIVVLAAILIGALGRLSGISDIVAYATIIWVGGILLVSFGWATGRHFWPPVLHLVYMLPLPGVLYYKMSSWLQHISSELGVWFLKLMSVPVFLDGNIIDLGVVQLHVAEACSGLRYLFPILSFSYLFAVLYKGPIWHKAVLLVSAAPIAVLMNSVRISVAGVIAQYYGVEWLNGFSHFFEGWVIFIASILILFGMAWAMLRTQRNSAGLSDALDLETSGLAHQASRLKLIRSSSAMTMSAILILVATAGIHMVPERGPSGIKRESFSTFPRRFGEWQQAGAARQLSPSVVQTLGADDYRSVSFSRPGDEATVEFFSAWYADQSQGGVHSPEICLPGGGWEIAWLERTDITVQMGWETPFQINRAIIQKAHTRMLVFYWFEQKGRKIAWDFAAKYWLMVDGISTGRTDGALVRLTTEIIPGESDSDAEERLMDLLQQSSPHLSRFIPEI